MKRTSKTIEFDDANSFWNESKQYTSGGSFACGSKNVLDQFMFDNYEGELSTNFNDIKIFNIDIEVHAEKGFPHPEDAEWPINAITVKYNNSFYIWGLPLNNEKFEYTDKRYHYNKFKTESDLMMHFIKFWSKEAPHIVTGWNSEFFDIPYVYNRTKKLLGSVYANKLSPYNICKMKTKRISKYKEGERLDIAGVSQLDYIALYKKFILSPRENYKLDTIAEVELNEKKLDYEEYGSLKKLYIENYQTFMDYNVKDVELVSRLDDKLNLLRLAITIANFAKVNYEDVFSPIRTWESAIYHHLMNL